MRRMQMRRLTVIESEIRLIRHSLIELNGKADMLFSVLSSIRNDQQFRVALESSKRKKKGGA